MCLYVSIDFVLVPGLSVSIAQLVPFLGYTSSTADQTGSMSNEEVECNQPRNADVFDGQDSGPLQLHHKQLELVLQAFKSNPTTKKYWEGIDEKELSVKLSTKERISHLRHSDFNVLHDTIKNYLPKSRQVFRNRWLKDAKVHFVSSLLGYEPLACHNTKVSKKSSKSPLSLKSIATNVLKRKAFPKMALRAALCRYLYVSEKLQAWYAKGPFFLPTKVEGIDTYIENWFALPERNERTGKLLCKSIDCSHNFTHLRVRTCSGDILGVSPDAWKACAKSGQTKLSLPLVHDVIDKQSVPNARTHFSFKVEKWMIENNYLNEANFVRLVRDWYDASDTPGIPACERVEKLVAFRSFLLRGVDFSSFPPNTRYFKGVPCVTFEGLLIDIDTKLQLYALTPSYNIRSVGSLAAETTVGLLQAMYPNPQVSIKARDIPSLMSTAVEIMTCKSNPDRGFRMRTSRTSGVYPDYEGERDQESITSMESQSYSSGQITVIKPRDHYFDTVDRVKSRRRIKFGAVSGPEAPSRGALPVRQYHRKDESKILPTKRLGIEITED